MATRNLNLRNYLTLDPKGFQKGLNLALRNLESFRRDFMAVAGALGASIGLGSIISSLKDTATQLNVARATLENTSKGFGEYKSNLEFVDRLSKEYKQDLVTLTDSFAKFHAAAQGTNFSLSEQKSLFEGLTKAATYFHMSSERTENMLIAVEQMMSKGKVTAEELRRQLGNNLPGAYAKMAQAAIQMEGVINGTNYSAIKSFADFESAMKKGQIGVETLTKFVQNLEEEIGDNINLDSLQLQLNDLKNAWTNLVDSAEVEKALTKIYKAATNTLNWIKDNLGAVSNAIISLAVGAISAKLIPAIVNIAKAIKAVEWSSWVGIAIAGIIQLTGWLVRMGNKLNEVNRTLKEINGIQDDTQRLYELQKTYHEYQEFVRANASKYGGMNRQDYQNSLKPAVSWPQLPGVDTRNSLSEESRNYFDKLEALPEIRKQIEEIQQKLDPNGGMHPDRTDFVEPVNTNVLTGGSGGSKGKKDKTITDVLNQYAEEVKKLKNQLKEGSITTAQAKDELDKLSVKAWENVTEFDNLREELEKLPPEVQDIATELEGAFDSAKFREKAKEIKKESDKIAKKWAGLADNRSDRARDFQQRNTRFDYRKTDYELLRDEADQWEKVAQDLKKDQDYLEKNFKEMGEAAKGELDKVNKALEDATQHVTNLRDAADVAEWKAEIADLSKELDRNIGDAFKDVAQDLNSVIKGAQKLEDIMNDTDATGWERFYAILSEVIKTYEVLVSLMETYETISKAVQALNKAKSAEELSNLAATQIAQTAVNAEKAAEIGLTEAATVAEGKDAAAALVATSAKSGEAIAGATASGAKMPFPYNLAAIALGIAAVIGALASISKFATGGIVGGNSRFGDNNLARVNSGEMILNNTQQARLWNMVNGKTSPAGGTGGKVEFEIKGDKLVGVLRNHSLVKRG